MKQLIIQGDSYGSGVAASLFSAHFVPSDRLTQLVQSLKNLRERLDQRIKTVPEEFDVILKKKELTHHIGTNSNG
jgi:3-hydroxy-3-methylglutaryl CoA synthase